MSLFASLMGDLDDDPFMGGHMRRMNSVMNSFFRDPFADMMMGGELVPFAGRQNHRGHEVARYGDLPGMEFPMMPMGMVMGGMGFPNIGGMFQNMSNNPNCHSFSSSTVMTMTRGPDGRPQVYQASQSVKQGPGGVRETKKTVADSRTGVKKMAIGHHINERGHVIEREQNVYSGDQEERQDFINLDEEEAESFNREWEEKARVAMKHNRLEYGKGSRRREVREPQLALPSTAPTHNSRYTARSSRHPVHYSPTIPSSKPSTSVLIASDSEDEAEVEEENKGTKPETVLEKRKLTTDFSDDSSEDDEPQPKKANTSRNPPKSK